MVFQSILLNFLGRNLNICILRYMLILIYIISHHICAFLKWILPDGVYYSFMASKCKGKLLLARILFRNFCIYKFVVFRGLWGFVFGVMLPLKKIIKCPSCLYSLIWFKSCGNYYSMIVWKYSPEKQFCLELLRVWLFDNLLIFFYGYTSLGTSFPREIIHHPTSTQAFFPFLPSLSPFFSYSIFLRIKLLQLISLLLYLYQCFWFCQMYIIFFLS